ncbi:SOS response-associated peptidase [Nocardioides sp. NPDC057772]|uniref:SOS response-associated peptidase n=1 Tax=Nocardioides sp. NPDC057772 TaxID=3346245 RepID=UPI00366FC3F5
MCGRYASSRQPDELAEEFEIDELRLQEPLTESYNVAPTDEVYAVLERPPHSSPRGPLRQDEENASTERQLRAVRWGLVPSWAKDVKIGNRMINARMETVSEKPAYRRAFAKRRCLLPADGYFEWYATDAKDAKGKPRKQPYFITPKDGGVLAMAGLYELWPDPAKDEDDPTRWLWSCTVITTEAEDSLGRIHDRMPLMVERARWDQWLDPTRPGDVALLTPAAPGQLEAYPVSTLVSNVRNNGRELIEPLPLEEAWG